MKTKSSELSCPCGQTDGKGRLLPRGLCCGPALDTLAQNPAAADAVALMRSRYSAFVECNTAYLLATWHSSTRPATLELDASCRWLGLEVRSSRLLGPTEAEVEFVARSRQAGRGQRLHERSRFLCEEGRWYYVDGEFLS